MNTTRERPLAGKVALVTGGSRGIGAVIRQAPHFAEFRPNTFLVESDSFSGR